jgi:hypothetical protein
MGMTEQLSHAAREREEITNRLAHFKATQQKFEREREEYYATTLGNACRGLGQTESNRIRGPAALLTEILRSPPGLTR